MNAHQKREVKESELLNKTLSRKRLEDHVYNDGKPNVYKFTKLHGNVHFNHSVKNKLSKLKLNDHGYFFGGKSVSDTDNLNNRSDNSVGDGVHYLDPNGKSFLKTLMGPHTLSHTRTLNYGKKPYPKSFRTAVKFPLP